MKTLLIISALQISTFCFGQNSINFSGNVFDQSGNPINQAAVVFGSDTAYTNERGQFLFSFPKQWNNSYYFYISKAGYFTRHISCDTVYQNIYIDSTFLRNRKYFWVESKQILKSDLGITVKEALMKFKLDISECRLVDEPPGVYRGFYTELADSSIVNFSISHFFSEPRIKMENILNSKIIGFGISPIKGKERIIGKSIARYNPYKK